MINRLSVKFIFYIRALLKMEVEYMKKVKIEDMRVTISYGQNKVDKDRLCDIFIDIIKELEKEGAEYETECSAT